MTLLQHRRDGCDEELLHVLDLPQIYTKPTARTLLETLALLTVGPPSWDSMLCDTSARAQCMPPRVMAEGVPAYLTKIISSPLAWIENDEDREEIWETASVRLSERSGRSGMGAMTRMFRIPTTAEATNIGSTMDSVTTLSDSGGDWIDLRIHEPALTEDNLGLKTWASSYLLAKRLHTLRKELSMLTSTDTRSHDSEHEHPSALELGAGTGLVGMAAAAVLHCKILLTDLPDIVPNLAKNAATNMEVIANHGGSCQTAVLDWSTPSNLPTLDTHHAAGDDDKPYGRGRFRLILVADPLYDRQHPRLLVQTIEYHLSRSGAARVVVELPLRDAAAYAQMRRDFCDGMRGLGLLIVREGEETGLDDWRDERGEGGEVRCWWSVWGWGGYE
ncbi:Protein-lysine N-methyltransferase rrg1 [Elasticomyces elasticus]|nr:Protein-lysine N-methyltransferase rrg1 [Elasticomyces elasticus]